MNGKRGDNPISDMMIYGTHPFPEDMEVTIRLIHSINPELLDELGWEPFEWAKGKRPDQGREMLTTLLCGHLPPRNRFSRGQKYLLLSILAIAGLLAAGAVHWLF
jgi:hypothetical protein